MRKNFGVKTWLYPMPVFIVAAYDENGLPNAMNAAWGGIYTDNMLEFVWQKNTRQQRISLLHVHLP